MKKTVTYILSLLVLCITMLLPIETAYAADIAISANQSSVSIGDSVTVTVTVPEGVSGTMNVIYPSDLLEYSKASAEVNANKAGTVAISIGKNGLTTSNKITITFKAKTAGEATIKANGIDFFNDETYDSVALGDSSTKITINNERQEDELSSDYYLAKLNVTAGSNTIKLSPTFNYRKTNYTATVEHDVTNVVVSVTRSSGKAEIVSITDNGKVDLEIGANKIEIVVKAENGKTLTYTVTVTRQEKTIETQEPENPTESQPSTENPEPATPDFEHGGVGLYVATEIPDEKIPENFVEKTVILTGGKEVQGLFFEKADLTMLYLENENKAGSFYIYNAADNYIYPFVKLSYEESYVIILLPEDEKTLEGYQACTLSIEGKGVVNAYQLQNANTVEMSDFYLVYCVNHAGTKGWYQYDSLEGTYQRYVGNILAETITPNTQTPSESETQADSTVNQNPPSGDVPIVDNPIDWSKLSVIICVAVFLCAVIVIIIINVFFTKRRKNDEDDEEEYEEEYEDYDDKQVFKKDDNEEIPETKEEKSEEDEVEFIDL